MGERGPQPRPIEEKRRLGSPGHHPMPKAKDTLPVEPLDIARIGESPASLVRAAAQRARWLAVTDEPAVSMLVESLVERDDLREKVMRYGDKDDRRALRDLDASILQQMKLLAFPPGERGKLGMVEVKAASTLERMRNARRQQSDAIDTKGHDGELRK